MQSADPPPQQAVVGVFAFQIGFGIHLKQHPLLSGGHPPPRFRIIPRTLDLILAVTHDFAFDEVDHFFGDVGGVIGDSLQVP